MTAPLRYGLLAALTGAVAVAAACDRTPRGSSAPAPREAASDARAQAAPAPAVAAPAVDAAVTSRMQGFWCERYLGAGKAPQGPLTVHFRPTSPTDFTCHIEFNCRFNCRPDYGPCHYAADIRAEHGVYQGAMRGLRAQCSQSTVDGFAFDCGYFLNSSVVTVVKARAVTRTVHFEFASGLNDSIPDQKPGDESYGCLPFVLYDKINGHTRKSLDNNYFTFTPEQCHLDP